MPDEFRTLEHIRDKGLIRLPLERFYIEFLADVGKKFRFDELYLRCQVTEVNEDLKIKVIGYSDLINLKISVHRAKDLEDVKNLERIRNITEPKSNSFRALIRRLFRF